ncbi:MAG: T9SS type A sorting domain-containing protein [Bacteroidota bacterium]
MRYLLSVLFLWTASLNAQSIDRFVIGATGGYDTNATIQLESTLGELAVETVQSGNLIFHQGFHQTNPPFNTDVEDDFQLVAYRLFPNPTAGQLQLELSSEQAIELEITVWDLKGAQTAIPAVYLNAAKTHMVRLDLRALAAGTYFCRIENAKTGAFQALQVQKR